MKETPQANLNQIKVDEDSEEIQHYLKELPPGWSVGTWIACTKKPFLLDTPKHILNMYRPKDDGPIPSYDFSYIMHPTEPYFIDKSQYDDVSNVTKFLEKQIGHYERGEWGTLDYQCRYFCGKWERINVDSGKRIKVYDYQRFTGT